MIVYLCPFLLCLCHLLILIFGYTPEAGNHAVLHMCPTLTLQIYSSQLCFLVSGMNMPEVDLIRLLLMTEDKFWQSPCFYPGMLYPGVVYPRAFINTAIIVGSEGLHLFKYYFFVLFYHSWYSPLHPQSTTSNGSAITMLILGLSGGCRVFDLASHFHTSLKLLEYMP